MGTQVTAQKLEGGEGVSYDNNPNQPTWKLPFSVLTLETTVKHNAHWHPSHPLLPSTSLSQGPSPMAVARPESCDHKTKKNTQQETLRSNIESEDG